MSTQLRAAALLSAAALLPACGCKSWNNSLALSDASGAEVELGTFQPADVGSGDTGITVAEIRRPTPTFTGLSRDHWQPVNFLVPTAGAEHGALGYRDHVFTELDVRATGAYPNADSCLRTYDTEDNFAQMKTVFFAPLIAAMDIPLAIPRTFRAPPGEVVMERPIPYQREPRSGTGLISPVEPPASESSDAPVSP